MKSETILTFTLDAADLDRVGPRLERILPSLQPGTEATEVRFHRSEAEVLAALEALLDAEGVAYTVSTERRFQTRELRGAAALRLRFEGTVVLASGASSPVEGACPFCGQGGEQRGELVLPDPVTPPQGFSLTTEGQLLVDEVLARAMVEERISGCLLRGVRDPSGEARDLFQLQPTVTLPPAQTPPTRIETDDEARCPFCRRGGLKVTSLLFYSLPVAEIADCNVCREVGSVGSGLVISQRFFRLLQDCGVKPPAAEPVMLV